MKRLTIANVLFNAFMVRWDAEHWEVHYHLQPKRNEPLLLATVDRDTHTVHMYPHPTGSAPEQSGLHEVIHIGLGLDGDKQHESWTYYMESWLWKRLTKKQRERLLEIFVHPMNNREP